MCGRSTSGCRQRRCRCMMDAAKWSRKAERIKAFVFSVGNLGHNRDMSYYGKYPFLVRKCISMEQRVGDLLNHARTMYKDQLSLFDYDLFSGRGSRCETNHFHIILESSLKWPLKLNDQRVKGVFMHEYVHYIQHLCTLCGLSISENYNRLFVVYRDFLEYHNTIEMPQIDEISVAKEDIETARLGRTAVPVKTYNKETKQWNTIYCCPMVRRSLSKKCSIGV